MNERTKLLSLMMVAVLVFLGLEATAHADEPEGPPPAPTAPAPVVEPPAPAKAPNEYAPSTLPKKHDWHLGAHAELDVGAMIALRQSAALAGGVVYGPFRAGISYATFLSNKSFGGTPDGFTLRANYILGINASYFIGRHTDEGFYVQAMFHIKEQGVTNIATGDHRNLPSLAAGVELGFVWKVYQGLYIAPRIGALYYVKNPQPDNKPVRIGNLDYDNSRHKNWDTYLIPTISVGYSW